METLALTVFVNQETAVGSRQSAVTPTRYPLPSAVCGLPTCFITFAVEIEGDALRRSAASPAQDDTATPIYFFAEAVDD